MTDQIDLTQIDLKDLEAELKRRQDEIVEKQKRLTREAEQRILDNIDALLNIVQYHTRSSCSDDSVINGIGSGSGYARCKRCLLLEVRSQNSWPEGYELDLNLPLLESFPQ